MQDLGTKISAVLVSFVLIILAFFHQTFDFNNKRPGQEISLSIPDGATGVEIGDLLENSGVIKSAKFFVEFYLSNASARGIAPGIHAVQTHISTKVAVSQLLDQKRIKSAVRIVEGTTYSDVLQELRKSKNVLSDAPNLQSLQIPFQNPRNSLEGQIYPAIYSFEPGTSTNRALAQMLSKFKSAISDIHLKGYGKYSPYQVLTIASMVQVEGDAKDFAKVARTIYNRLKVDMPLQLNSTVQYAANLRGRIALSTAATNINSPYNTYKHIGLPPTPISNPSIDAIKAALNPETGDWLYFITVKPGDTRFTKDYNEFQSWNDLYNKNLANGLFK